VLLGSDRNKPFDHNYGFGRLKNTFVLPRFLSNTRKRLHLTFLFRRRAHHRPAAHRAPGGWVGCEVADMTDKSTRLWVEDQLYALLGAPPPPLLPCPLWLPFMLLALVARVPTS
jgi:hypothetical protein